MKKRIWALALAFVLVASQFAFASSVVTKEYQFQTTNPDYSKYTVDNIGTGDMKDIPVTIKNGFFTVKRVTDIKISLLSEEKPKKKVYSDLTEKKVPKNAEEVTIDGKKLKLVDVEWEEYSRTPATGSITKYGYENQPSFPKTKDLTYTLDSGKVIKTVGYLKSVSSSGKSYTKDFTVKGKFVGDPDVDYYNLDGTQIENNPDTPAFVGYENTILNHFGLNPKSHKITGAKWTSDYKEVNGQTVRYAEFYGKKLSNNWTAYYEEDFSRQTSGSLQKSLYEATCYYGTQKESIYNVNVVVEYGKTEIIIGRVVAVSAGVLVLSALAAFFLLTLAKKKKKDSESEADA